MNIIGYIIVGCICLFFTWYFVSLIIKLIRDYNHKWQAALIGVIYLWMVISIAMIFIKPPKSNRNPNKVYICTGPQSNAYHSKRRCKGLMKCSESIETVTIEEAEQMNRHPCKFCCK